MARSKQTQATWLFEATERDMVLVDAERDRLRQRNPDLEPTRSDAIRSLFTRGSSLAEQPVGRAAEFTALMAGDGD